MKRVLLSGVVFLIASSAAAVSAAQPTSRAETVQYTRNHSRFDLVPPEQLSALGINPQEFGESWQVPHEVIWSDVLKDKNEEDGIRRLSFFEALQKCRDIGGELATEQDYASLITHFWYVKGYWQRQHYAPQILPNLEQTSTFDSKVWTATLKPSEDPKNTVASAVHTSRGESSWIRLHGPYSPRLAARCVWRKNKSPYSEAAMTAERRRINAAYKSDCSSAAPYFHCEKVPSDRGGEKYAWTVKADRYAHVRRVPSWTRPSIDGYCTAADENTCWEPPFSCNRGNAGKRISPYVH